MPNVSNVGLDSTGAIRRVPIVVKHGRVVMLHRQRIERDTPTSDVSKDSRLFATRARTAAGLPTRMDTSDDAITGEIWVVSLVD